MDELCAGYTEEELTIVADFLRRTTEAGSQATEALAEAEPEPRADLLPEHGSGALQQHRRTPVRLGIRRHTRGAAGSQPACRA